MAHSHCREFHAEPLSGVPIIWPADYQRVTLRRLVWNDVERIVGVKRDVGHMRSIEVGTTINVAVTRSAGKRVSKHPGSRFIEVLDPCDQSSLSTGFGLNARQKRDGAQVRLIRFGGHLPKGGYDVHTWQRPPKPTAASAVR